MVQNWDNILQKNIIENNCNALLPVKNDLDETIFTIRFDRK
jgi:hypothetical protein